jgi:hypothetical protein
MSSSLRGICRQTEAHDYRRLLIHISVLLTILVLIFGRVDAFVWLLGFFSLGLESTLPLPQFITLVTSVFKHCALLIFIYRSNYKQKSLYGFRMSTLIGWVGGDSFKYSHISSTLVTKQKIHEFLAGRFTFLHKGALFSSRFVPFSNSQWTSVGVGSMIVAET